MKKRLLSLALTLGLCLAMCPPVSAAYSGPEVVQLEAGSNNSGVTAVTADGTLWGWGGTFFGAFDEAPLRPQKLMTGVRSVALSKDMDPPYTWKDHGTYFGDVSSMFGVKRQPYKSVMLIVKENGDLYGVGDNLLGQMGQGAWSPNYNYLWDDQVYIMGNVKKADCSVALCAAITNDNDLYVWGGIGNRQEFHRTMKPEKVLSNVKDVAVGASHLAAVTYDGSVYTMGNGWKGCLGNGVFTHEEYVQKPVKVFDGGTAVAAGNYFTAVLKNDGTVWGWGWEDFNQLGQYEELVPCSAEIASHTSIKNVPLHYANSAFNFNFETKTGNGVYYLKPVQIVSNVKAISAGNDNLFFIKNDNTLWGQGNNVGGVLGGYSSYNDKWFGKIFPYYAVQIDSNVKLVSNGGQYSSYGRMLYMKNDGSMWGLGHLSGGFMGNGRDVNDGQPGPSANVTEASVLFNEWCYLKPTPAAFSAPGFNYSAPAKPKAKAGNQDIEIDGKKTAFQTYLLSDESGNGTNYVKLRDIAHVLNGTGAQFSVGYNKQAQSISASTGKTYKDTGTEMDTPFAGADKEYVQSQLTIVVDGKAVKLDAITLADDAGNGYNYFKLRDLGDALGFTVGYSRARGVYVETK